VATGKADSDGRQINLQVNKFADANTNPGQTTYPRTTKNVATPVMTQPKDDPILDLIFRIGNKKKGKESVQASAELPTLNFTRNQL